MGRLWALLRETYAEWDRHHAPKLGAGLAYYTVLSLAPLLIVVLSIVGFVFGPKAAEGQMVDQIRGLVGAQGAEAIQTVIAHANQPKTGVAASILGVLTLFLGASGVFTELHDALNTIWDVPANNTTGVWSLVRQRFLSFGMVLAIGFLLLVSLVVSAGVTAAGTYMKHLLPAPAMLLEGVNFLVSLAVVTVLFALIYRFLPDEKVAWRDVWTGSLATAILFTAGKFLIGLYLGKASVGSAYGAAGSLIVVLVWIYYSAQIFFFGAEFTHVYARWRRPEAFGAREAPVVTVPAPIDAPRVQESSPPVEPAVSGGALQQWTDPRPGEPGVSPAIARVVGVAALAALGGLGWYRARSSSRKSG